MYEMISCALSPINLILHIIFKTSKFSTLFKIFPFLVSNFCKQTNEWRIFLPLKCFFTVLNTEIHDNRMSKYNFHITIEEGISSKRIVFYPMWP